MSRGGRGGGGAGRMGGQSLPFEVDTALEDQIAQYRADAEDDDDWSKTLYPTMKVHLAPPPTAREKRNVQRYREIRTARHNGPFYVDSPKTGKRDLAEFNAFDDVSSYGNKKHRRSGGLPNLKQVPIVKELMPRELWSVFTDGDNNDDSENTTKNLNFLKKKRLDKLAQFDDIPDADPAAADRDDDDDADKAEDGGEEEAEELQDDNFSEDDDDMGGDYNAEKYFDDGDGDDDGGGEDGGGDDACDAFVNEPKPATAEPHDEHLGDPDVDEIYSPKTKTGAERYRNYDIHGKDPFSEKDRANEASDILIRKANKRAGLLYQSRRWGWRSYDKFGQRTGEKIEGTLDPRPSPSPKSAPQSLPICSPEPEVHNALEEPAAREE